MNRLTRIIQSLESQYPVNIDDFLDLYVKKFSKIEIGDKLGLSYHTVRQLGDKLGLPWKRSERGHAFVTLSVERASEAEVAKAPIDELSKENDYLSRQLMTAQNNVQRLRDEANQLRKTVRDRSRTNTLEEKVQDIVKQALPMKRKGDLHLSICATPSDYYKDHVSCLLLSDLHVEEAVSKKDVGDSGEYNWDIMERRLAAVFEAWLNAYRGESKGVVFLLGDLFSGIIHDTLESTTKPLAEAIGDLSDIMADYILSASAIMQIEVYHVSGNHERLSERVKSASKGFDFGYLFANILKAKLTVNSDITMDISTTGYVSCDVNGKIVGGHHGDQHRGVKSEARTFVVQEAFKSILGVDVHHILEGHTHKFSYHNTNRGASICNGSLIGTNAYGVTNGFTSLKPSQTIILFDQNGDIDYVKQVHV